MQELISAFTDFKSNLENGIGKMRRPGLASEGFCEHGLPGKENCGRLAGKLIEVSNQMRLIVVTAFDRDRCPRCVGTFDRAKHLLKSQNAAEKFWSNADFAHEPPFQLTAAEARVVSKLVYRDQAGKTNYARRKQHRRGIARAAQQPRR